MNPLSNAKDCLLYDLKFRMITTARFSQSSPSSLTLILFSRPDRYFPERFRLVPAEYAKQGFPSYVCTLPSAFSAYRSEADGETYYIAEIPLQEARNQREDLRVNVDLEVPAFFNESEIPDMITIKNISAGGLMFLSPKQFGKYTPFLFHAETKKGGHRLNRYHFVDSSCRTGRRLRLWLQIFDSAAGNGERPQKLYLPAGFERQTIRFPVHLQRISQKRGSQTEK